MATPIRLYEIATATAASLANNEMCNETAANATTGFKMWGAKNDAGEVVRFLCLDENAQVADLVVTGDITTLTGSITTDALSLSTLVAHRILYADFQQDGSFKYEGSKLRIGSSDTPAYMVDIADNFGTGLRLQDAGAGTTAPSMLFEKASASPADNDPVGNITMKGYDGDQSTPVLRDYVIIEGKSTDVSGISGELKTTVLREGVGETFLQDGNGFEISRGIIALKETTTPTAKQHHGKIYPKSDNALYFQDGAGIEKRIAVVGSAKAEMFMYEATETVTINTQDKYHAIKGFTGGSLNDWTFQDGRVVDANITSEADNTIVRIVTSGAHALTTGDIITCTKMNNAAHNMPTAVTVIDATTFDCDDITYVGNAGVSEGVIDEPSYIQAGAEAAGDYKLSFSCSGEAVGADTFKLEAFHIAAEKDNTAAELDLAINDLGPIPGGGFVDGVVEGDRIWLGCYNTSGTSNFLITHANVNVHRL